MEVYQGLGHCKTTSHNYAEELDKICPLALRILHLGSTDSFSRVPSFKTRHMAMHRCKRTEKGFPYTHKTEDQPATFFIY